METRPITSSVEKRNFEADKRTALPATREVYHKLLPLKSLKSLSDLEISGLHHALSAYLHNFHKRLKEEHAQGMPGPPGPVQVKLKPERTQRTHLRQAGIIEYARSDDPYTYSNTRSGQSESFSYEMIALRG